MKKTRIIIGLVISLFVIPSVLTIFMAPTVKADTYSSDLDMNKEYTYNFTQWDSKLNWLVNGTSKANITSNAGGQIRVNFTGVYNYEGFDAGWNPNIFENPVPFINISFFEKEESTLTLNHTFTNISSAEAANTMAIGYYKFDFGFLIPTDNFSRLNDRVLAQNVSYLVGTHKMEIFQKEIRISFKQESGGQNTTLIYDKSTGILAAANVKNSFVPDIEFQLNGYTIELKNRESILAYPIFILAGVSGITILISIFITRKKFKH